MILMGGNPGQLGRTYMPPELLPLGRGFDCTVVSISREGEEIRGQIADSSAPPWNLSCSSQVSCKYSRTPDFATL